MLPSPLIHLLLAMALAPANAVASSITAATSNLTVAAGWYAGYHVADAPLSSVLWSKYTHVIYAFATPTDDPGTIELADSDAELLPQFVADAHKNNVKAGLSIGGWGGSMFFSTNMATEQNRTAFVSSVLGLVQKYDLDLVDFDWEFPGLQGVGCNTVSVNDTENFLLMLQSLRASTQIDLTAATNVRPFPTTNSSLIPQFASVLTWLTPMVYDLSWNWTAGSPQYQRALPSAPLDDSCFSSTPGANGESALTPLGSASSAVQAWVDAGIPRNKIVLGVPAYAHSFDVNQTSAFVSAPSSSTSASPDNASASPSLVPYPYYNTLNHTPGDAWDGTGGVNECGVYSGPGGTFAFFSLVADKYLQSNGSIAPGVPYRWDECSQSPYLYAADHGPHGVLISYVDPRTFGVRGAFVRANGLAGFSMWEVGGDPDGVLLDAILTAPTNASLSVSASGSVDPAPASTASHGSSGAARAICVPAWTLGLALLVSIPTLLLALA
ncbi:Chitinase [Mycena chlorophos]|uniref:Chitinase n=1 Tax=Mycena chlorophos TaxID=658473 RepID=A0A8H6SW85_MYCCL|nr:Chitinase [Mycena chlorophos]